MARVGRRETWPSILEVPCLYMASGVGNFVDAMLALERAVLKLTGQSRFDSEISWDEIHKLDPRLRYEPVNSYFFVWSLKAGENVYVSIVYDDQNCLIDIAAHMHGSAYRSDWKLAQEIVRVAASALEEKPKFKSVNLLKPW